MNLLKLIMLSFILVISPIKMAAQDSASVPENVSLKVTGGPLVEGSFSGFYISGMGEESQCKMKVGFNAGGFVDFKISRYFSVQGELSFQFNQSEVSWNSEKGDYQYWGAEIPIYLMFHHGFSNGTSIFAGIGPYTDFGLSAKFKHNSETRDLYEKNNDSGLSAMKESATGFGCKLGYELRCGLQITFSYRMSINNVLDANSSQVKMHPQAIRVGLGWRFGK